MSRSATDGPPPCAAECALRARIGSVLFRHRSWIPVPLVLLLVAGPTEVQAPALLLGALVTMAGMAIRAAGVAAAGTSTRRRSRAVARLITHGAFAWVRNPLYLGNLLLWTGVLVATQAWLIAPGVLLAFSAIYACIVRYEEGVLESTFGDEYLAYKSSVPRWVPRRPARPASGARDWRSAWHKEWHSAAAFVVITAAIILKELALQG